MMRNFTLFYLFNRLQARFYYISISNIKDMIFRVGLAKIFSIIFPPLFSQRLRDLVFPISKGILLNKNFKKKSITGSYLLGNTSDYHGYRFYVHGFFDWRNVIIARAVKKHRKGDIVEIGANVGTETVSFCDLSNNRETVHAFEPLPSNIDILKQFIDTQTNFMLYQIGLSNKSGTVRFTRPPKTASGSGTVILNENANLDKTISIDIKRLDDFILSFNKVAAIFIDTEGHEPFVLDGSRLVIEKFRPVILIEASPKLLMRNSKFNLKSLYLFFEGLNYNVYKINSFSLPRINETNLKTNKSSNWLCLPKEQNKILFQIKQDLFIRSIIPWFLLKRMSKK